MINLSVNAFDTMANIRRPSFAEIFIDEDTPKVEPFLKWAGGKRWLTNQLRELVGEINGRYIEPFVGSGAIFFALQPATAILSDCNRELVNTYRALQTQHKAVERHLEDHQRFHCERYYYRIRDEVPSTFAKRAARFIYLNRTCWNGLYRVNLNGRFNVPIGTKDAVLMGSDNFHAVSVVLNKAEILHSDFEQIIAKAEKGDVVFCDPPYTVRHNHNGFVKYNENLFSWMDQVRLKDALVLAKDRGARIFVTNADHASIHELYEGVFDIQRLTRYSSIGGANAKRGNYSELLITG